MVDRNPLRIDTGTEPPIPPIAAAFLVNFDPRKGYTLGWHRSLDDIHLEGVVEYKSLPSGLHNIEEDLVYFIHDEYAGLSAFVNKHDEQAERAARMLAIGILVPLDHGRIGRSWRHAEVLKELARAQIEDPENTTALEEYWGKHRMQPGDEAVQTPNDLSDPQTNGYRKSRSMSATTAFISSNHALTPHHPALALLPSLQLFGPLIFPLYRAALLRKRILIVTDTPVEFACNLVYNISILSTVSKALLSLLPAADASSARLRSLFTVGVLDIPLLKQTQPHSDTGSTLDRGWVACTTDDVLSTKPHLYDVLVLMPRSESGHATTRSFPRIVSSTPDLTRTFPRVGIKSTQRDFYRFVHLQQGLRRFRQGEAGSDGDDATRDDDETSSISSQSSSYSQNKAVVESPSWSRMAYTSLVWWASAGDRRGGLAGSDEAEAERDFSLLHDEADEEQKTREVALVAYFHRMTAVIFQTLAEAVTRADEDGAGGERYHDDDDDDDEDNPNPSDVDRGAGAETGSAQEDEETRGLLAEQAEENTGDVPIGQEDMEAMGLDSWSAADKAFVEELVELWWRRKAVVRAASIDCCGLRIM